MLCIGTRSGSFSLLPLYASFGILIVCVCKFELINFADEAYIAMLALH